MKFVSIVSGMRSRGLDRRYGSGQFGASRDQGRRRHQGLDILAGAGQPVMCPIDGEVVREAVPYPPFTGILIRGTGEFLGYEVKLFYVKGLRCGPCSAGEVIGFAERLAIKYPGIPNHVHMEVRYRGALLSPMDVYGVCF